jgi:type I restriction enzyme M protein
MRNHEHRGFTNRHMVNSTSPLWLKEESVEDSANLPPPDIIAAEIVEDLEAALTQFAEIAADLGGEEKRET